MIERISQENEQFIEAAVAAGTYQNRAQALNQAVDLLRTRSSLLAHIDEGIDDLDAGRYTAYDETGLNARFDQLIERARSREKAVPGE